MAHRWDLSHGWQFLLELDHPHHSSENVTAVRTRPHSESTNLDAARQSLGALHFSLAANLCICWTCLTAMKIKPSLCGQVCQECLCLPWTITFKRDKLPMVHMPCCSKHRTTFATLQTRGYFFEVTRLLIQTSSSMLLVLADLQVWVICLSIGPDDNHVDTI